MPTTHDIVTQIESVIAEIEESGGEVTPEHEQALSSLAGDGFDKLSALRHVYLRREALATRWKAEAEHAKAQQKREERSAYYLRSLARQLVLALDEAGEEIPRGLVTRRESVDLSISPRDLPERFQTVRVREQTSIDANKTAIAAAINNGEHVNGARLIYGFSKPKEN